MKKITDHLDSKLAHAASEIRRAAQAIQDEMGALLRGLDAGRQPDVLAAVQRMGQLDRLCAVYATLLDLRKKT